MRRLSVAICAALLTSVLPTSPADAATLGLGSRGSAVTQLQRDLREKGFYRGPLDGIYGEVVSHAVMAFRKELGVARSFSWDSRFNDELRDYIKPWTPLRVGEPDRIEVNLTRQLLYLYREGDLRAVMPISTGNGELFKNESGELVRALTPVGNFKITRHVLGWRTSYLGQLYNPWYFTGGIAIHGSTSVPAQPVSHGCVRVTMWDSAWLEPRLFIGMPVHVWREPAGVGPKIGTTYLPDRSSVAPIPGRYLGDFDRDGLDDAASYADSNGTWWVAPHRTSATLWASLSTLQGWGERLVGDFTGDGRDDILNLHSESMTWWVSRSTGTSFSTTSWTEFATKDGWTEHQVGDFTGDGRDDLASFHPQTGNWVVSVSTGSGFINKTWTNFATRDGWSTHQVGDFTGDGRDDLASFHPQTGNWVVSISTGSGFINKTWTNFASPEGWALHLVGDFTGDGRDDLSHFNSISGEWVVSVSNGWSFLNETWTTFSTTTGWDMNFVADLNDDERHDIAIHHSSGVWWALMSTGQRMLNVKWTNSPPR